MNQVLDVSIRTNNSCWGSISFSLNVIVLCLPPLQCSSQVQDCPNTCGMGGNAVISHINVQCITYLWPCLSSFLPGFHSFALYCFLLLLTVSWCVECSISSSHVNVCAACVLKNLLKKKKRVASVTCLPRAGHT